MGGKHSYNNSIEMIGGLLRVNLMMNAKVIKIHTYMEHMEIAISVYSILKNSVTHK